jgi:ATP-binding cassette subfamily F protein uup
MPTARLDKVSLSFGLKPLLHDADLQIRKGERVCLLGRNGEGKSSLLQLITRQIVPDGGEVWVRPGARVASLAQEVSPASDASVREVVMSGLSGGDHEDWQADMQVDQVMARLELDADAAMGALSGGWRRRVMLGRALVAAPDLLLLDEPTNHLDIEAITWLEEMMLEFEGALLFISHDRTFVRRLATRIVELDRGQLRVWPGNYDAYVVQKRAALEVEAKHAALFDKKLAQEEVWIRQGVEARRTRNEGRVRALKQLRIQRSERRERIGQVEIRVQDAAQSGKLVFEAIRVTQRFETAPARAAPGTPAPVSTAPARAAPGRPAPVSTAPVIANFSVRIMRGDRIGIIGPNGCGKTTLIKLLVGELEPTEGEIRRGTGLLPAYFDQQREQLDPSASIMDNVTGGSGDTIIIDGQPRHVSGYLRDFLFPPERLHAPVSMLSGGERNRLLLARLFARPSNLLVMDEPTNDLDVETLELLEEMVANYAGTLLLVSHDRAFLDNVVTSTLVFEGHGQVNEYVGGYSDWLRQRRDAGAPAAAPAKAPRAVPKAQPNAGPNAAHLRRPRLCRPRLSYKDQRELDAMPEKIQRLEAEQLQLQALIADPALFQGSDERGTAALQRLAAVAAELENCYVRWDALESSGAGAGARGGAGP